MLVIIKECLSVVSLLVLIHQYYKTIKPWSFETYGI